MSGLSIKAKELEINPDDPFSDDALGRKEIAVALTNLVKDEENPLVVGLHGSWGTGKTYLLKRWQQELKNDNFQAIYFSAWEDDFIDDPLVSIIGQLWDELKSPAFTSLLNTAKECALPLLKTGMGNAIKSATAGIADFKADDFKSSAKQFFGEYANAHKKQKHLNTSLKKLAKKVRKDTKHPLIFIIDELDRCRPTYAISLLERIKHLFNVPNIVFVLGIDKIQLKISIESIYGSEMDTDNYLRRFIDINFSLPVASTPEFCKHMLEVHGLEVFFVKLSERAEHKVHTDEYAQFSSLFSKLVSGLGLSLREVEHIILSFVFVVRNMEVRTYMYPYMLAILLVLKVKDQELYQGFIQGKSSPAEVLDFLNPYVPPPEVGRPDILELQLYLSTYDDYRETNAIWAQLQLLSTGNELTEPEKLSIRARSMNKEGAEKFLWWWQQYRNKSFDGGEIDIKALKRLISRIELASQVLAD